MRILLAILLSMGIPLCLCATPHIIYLLADDLGYNDVSWQDPTIITPNLHALAQKGVILQNLYGMTACSPTRASLLTGRYASNIGSQHLVFSGNIPHGVPTDIPYLPKRLKENGYITYGVGKWHQGFCNESFIPTGEMRGFDHYYGFYQGGAFYYSHTTSELGPKRPGPGVEMFGYDLHNDGVPVDDPEDACVYSSELFRRKMTENILNHDPSIPMFQYCAFQLPHTPRNVPRKYYDMYPDILDQNRRIYYGQITYMDEIVKNITDTLMQKGMLENTLFIFHSDNGGDTDEGCSNHPYRGSKGTYFDGGIRLQGFVSGYGIEKTGYTHEGMFHVTDMHPTLVQGLVGGEISDNLDGINVWEAISTGADSPRTEFLITVDTEYADRPKDDKMGANISAIRVGDYKLMVGFPSFSYVTQTFGWYPPLNTEIPTVIPPPAGEKGADVFLYNLADDPYEGTNLASEMPDKVAELREKLLPYEASAWTFWPEATDAADPDNFNNFWDVGWC
ncbi:arylsulfatase B-like [Ptychodera flava]|uniref:arylsulfatase B-like n=1 Tax=Ptychodera flava TaxID=63121 RepID=UPI00396A8374